MKTKIIYFLALGLIFLSACKKDTDTLNPVQLALQIATSPDEVSFDIPLEKTEITLVNKANGATYSVTPDAQGTVVFESIAPGTYTLSGLLTLSAEEFTNLSGIYTETAVNFSFVQDNLALSSDSQQEITLQMSSQVGDWVLKQIYNYGSNVSQGASFRDQFVEIYNNSNKVLYADSLCFAIAYGKINNKETDYLLSNLQFDWAQSINMNAVGDANKDYIYAKSVFMIPSDGTGKKYPIQPGESFIIAQTAIDHTKPYTDNEGTEISIGDATLTIDLSNADFEAYLYNYEQLISPGRTKYRYDIDNPQVTDVDVIHNVGSRDMLLNMQGRESFVIFKVEDGTNFADFPKYAIPTEREVTTETTLYQQIPTKYILDGVEVEHPIATSRLPRRLPTSIDAGATFAPGGQYSGQSLVRKTKETIGGRRILQDTNNSTVDFGYLEKADPSKSSSSFID